MKEKIKSLFTSTLIRSSGIYTLSSIINASLPFLLLPYLTRVFTQEEYGTISMFLLLQAFLAPLVGLNINGAISRKYFSTEDRKEFANYIGNALFLMIISTILVFMACTIFNHSLSKLTDLSLKWLFLAILVAASQCIFIVGLTVYQVRGKAIYYGVLQVLQTALNLFLTILLIEQLDLGYEGRLYGIFISYFIFAFFTLFLLFYNGDLSFFIKKSHLKHVLKLGVPLIPHALGAIILGMADRFMIKNLVSTSSAGVYTVAYQVGGMLLLLTSSFNAAYIPWLFRKLKENNLKDKFKIVKLTYSYYIVLVLITVAICILLMWALPMLVGEKFTAAREFVPWVLLGLLFNGMYMMVANYIFFAEKTYLLAICTVISAIVYVPLAFLLIKHNGAIGACQASAFAYFLLFVLTWVVSQKTSPMPWFKLEKDE